MGHIRLAVLPRTRPWRAVLGLLQAGASDEAVIAASAIAIRRELAHATQDPVFVEAVRLLALIPQAARSPDFAEALHEVGLALDDEPNLPELLAAAGRRLDDRAKSTQRTDFGELSRRALIGTLARQIGGALPGLLDGTPEEVQAAAARMASDNAFARAARDFFGRLNAGLLSYWLDRTLSTHVGPGRRFPDVAARSAFDDALEQYCADATRIIREFASSWYGKTGWHNGGITTERAEAFAHLAMTKIGAELRRELDG